MAGNANSGPKKEKPFRTALMLELKRAGEDMPALRRGASKLVAMAEEGDIQAIKELNDRLDGKVPQGISNADEESFKMEHRVIVTGVLRAGET
jgi:hypothetical protein